MNCNSYEDYRFRDALMNSKTIEDGKKRQHFVPSFYLRNFTDCEGQIWVYNRIDNELFHNIPENICIKKFVYETQWENASEQLGKYVFFNDLEDFFAEKEKVWGPLIKTLLKRINIDISENKYRLICSRKEKDTLIDFFLCTYFRNPSALQDVVDYYENVPIEDNKEIVENLNALKKQFDMWGFGSPKSLLQHTTKYTAFNSEMKGSPLNVYTNEFRNLQLCFIGTKDCTFITSSFPTIFMEDDDNHSQYYILPISPSVALLFTNDSLWRDRRNKITIIRDDQVSRINMRYTDYGEDVAQFLIAKDREKLDSLKNCGSRGY